VKDLYIDLHLMNFQRTHNDLTYNQFQKIWDTQLYLTRVSPAKDQGWVKHHRNEALDLLARNPSTQQVRYEESCANFDPFKKRVLQGVARGLTMASIDHQTILENNLLQQNEQDLQFNEHRYPYRPDMIIGHKGQKVLLSVIPSTQTMRDVKKADGQV